MVGMATTSTALATATMLPSSSSLASSSSVGRGTLLVKVASLSKVEKFFYFFERKLKGKNLIKSCNRKILLQGDVTQLTTILTRFKLINLLP